jgi:hypothetical protein
MPSRPQHVEFEALKKPRQYGFEAMRARMLECARDLGQLAQLLLPHMRQTTTLQVASQTSAHMTYRMTLVVKKDHRLCRTQLKAQNCVNDTDQ